MRVDVAIAGAGPAGSACAISLRARQPSLSVALIERSHFDEPRAGESLSPAARPMLAHLGVLPAFLRAGHTEVHGTAAAWGGEALRENEFLLLGRGPGWHLDRARFDALLANHARSRGATLLLGASVHEAVHDGDAWRLALANGETIEARFLVDATGSAAIARRFCGARAMTFDALVSFGRFFEDAPHADTRTVVEAFEHGWWYTAALPNGSRFAACMTDGNIARRLQVAEEAQWSRALQSMPQIASIVRGAKPLGPIIARACGSQRLDPVAGTNWLATGDAASRLDPLSSAGITKALRSGMFASYAVADAASGDQTGLRRYARITHAEFEAYLQTRARVYAEEQRWPSGGFWSGRASAAR